MPCVQCRGACKLCSLCSLCLRRWTRQTPKAPYQPGRGWVPRRDIAGHGGPLRSKASKPRSCLSALSAPRLSRGQELLLDDTNFPQRDVMARRPIDRSQSGLISPPDIRSDQKEEAPAMRSTMRQLAPATYEMAFRLSATAIVEVSCARCADGCYRRRILLREQPIRRVHHAHQIHDLLADEQS